MSPTRAAPAAVLALMLGLAFRADAQLAASAPPEAFGGRARADAGSRIITLAVQQAISSLPPSSGQTAAYTYDPRTDAYVVSRKPGPVAFRSPATIGKGRIGVRMAATYFDLDESFGPANYTVVDPRGRSADLYTRFGLTARAEVGLMSLAADYGLTERLQLTLTVPVTVVDASAFQTFPTFPVDAKLPPGEADVAAANIPDLDALFEAGDLAERTESIDTADERFRSGTAVGIGRISVGGKLFLGSFEGIESALGLEFFCPSPSEAEFAGSASPSILGRAIVGYELGDFELLLDLGYDYDFDVAELRRFVWNLGASAQLPSVTMDAGFGGSVYDQGIEWTPAVAAGPSNPIFPDGSTLVAESDNRLGTNLLDFLVGFKLRVAHNTLLSATAVVPLNDEGARPDAIGTAAIETYF
jgi:hypothetical protein